MKADGYMHTRIELSLPGQDKSKTKTFTDRESVHEFKMNQVLFLIH